ncbi:MAG: ABC transporter permease [Actinomycetota bacterium]|nr:ABC transporter permease [Actinomycetota bacterium]
MKRWRRAARVAQYALVLWAAISLNFLLPHLAPGDPVDVFTGDANALNAEERARLRADYDLDGSLAEQYGRSWARLVRGDLGTSVRYSRPVASVLADRLPWTLALVGLATVIAFAIGVAAGASAARRRGRRGDVVAVSGLMALDAMPGFWIGMVLLAVFAVQLGWLPSFGAVPLDAAPPSLVWLSEVGRRLVLPVATLVLATVGSTFLLARAAMVSALEAPYVGLAEAAGLSPRRIVYRHALRNALLPLFTHLTLTLGTLLSGAVVVETVFSYPGLGRVAFEAVQARDHALLQGAFLLVTVTVIAANVVADLAYPWLDPRVRRAPMVKPA